MLPETKILPDLDFMTRLHIFWQTVGWVFCDFVPVRFTSKTHRIFAQQIAELFPGLRQHV